MVKADDAGVLSITNKISKIVEECQNFKWQIIYNR